MSAIKPPSEGSRVIVIVAAAALVYAVVLFALYGRTASHTLASWIGRLGSMCVIAGVLVHRSKFAFLRRAQPGDRYPLLTPLLISAGMIAIVMGFALTTIGW